MADNLKAAAFEANLSKSELDKVELSLQGDQII